jgi:phage terminase large subunit
MDLNPTLPQANFAFTESQFPLFVGGFGAGKTESLLVRALMLKRKYPQSDFAWYCPTFDLIRLIAYPRWEALLVSLGISHKILKSPVNELHISGMGKIIFRSMDNPSRIVGYQVGHSFFDELDTLKKSEAAYVWRQALARNRQSLPDKAPNTMAVATTPEGFRFCYDTWERNPKDGYELIRAPTSSNPHNPEGYVKTLMDAYPANLLEAYLEGKFVNLTSGSVYTSFDRVECGSDETMQDGEHLYIGLDFNVGNMSAVIHVLRDGFPVAVGEICQSYDTPEICRIIKEKYKDKGHAIYIYPDASGDSRKSMDASKTDISIIKSYGFSVRAKKTNPRIRDRINSMNAAFESGYQVNPNECPEYTRCLEQQSYGKNGEPDKTQGLDHLPDGGGYYINYEFGLNKPKIYTNDNPF